MIYSSILDRYHKGPFLRSFISAIF